MGWLIPSLVRQDAEQKTADLEDKIRKKFEIASSSYEHELMAKVVGRNLNDGLAIRKDWFFATIGIDWSPDDPNDRETWYLCRAPISATFTQENVIHWTHWIGSVYVRLKEAIQDGKFPETMTYGPPNREPLRRTVGPLVHYQFAGGKLSTFDFRSFQEHFQEMVEAVTADLAAPQPAAEAPPHFGLKDIVQLQDIAQDDQIRGRMGGILTLIGGPGTDKTTVALHRIPYLLLEQKDQLALEFPGIQVPYFTTDTMHVVVWKEHLVPYLKECLLKLNFGEIAVQHIEDWVASRLRAYIKIGKAPGEYQIREEPDEFARMKLGFVDQTRKRVGGLGESLLQQFITGKSTGGEYLNSPANESFERLREFQSETNALLTELGFTLTLRDPMAFFEFTASGIEVCVKNIRSNIDLLADEVRAAGLRGAPARITRIRERLSALRDAELDRIGANYPSALTGFYKSEIVRRELAKTYDERAIDRFIGHIEDQARQRYLSRSDRYFMLWLILQMTQNTDIDKPRLRALPQYTHTIIDEAQYYHPLVLRLLVRLARSPVTSMRVSSGTWSRR